MARGRLLAGLIIIGLGGLFLLQNLGYREFSVGLMIRDYWPAILIVIGLNVLFTRKSGAWFGALVLIGIGVALLGLNLEWWVFQRELVWKLLWPVVLIVVGIRVLWQPRRRRENPFDSRDCRVVRGDFQAIAGNHYEAVLGALTVDLTARELADGDNVIDLNAVLGKVEVLVPKGTPVALAGSCVLGGVEFFERATGGVLGDLRMEHGDFTAAKRIRIIANVVFGGIEIKAV